MKDIFKSLKENATSRLKNPIIGAFVLAWCALNISGLATFFLSDNEAKLRIVSTKVWSFSSDIIVPLVIGIIYLLLLPLLNLAYEFINEGVINNFRDNQQNQNDKRRFIRQKSTVAAKIEADEEYIRKLKDSDIEGWVAEQGDRNREFISQKEKYASLLVTFSEKENHFKISNSLLKRDLNETHSKLTHLEGDVAVKLSYLESALTEMDKKINALENQEYDSTNLNIKELRSSVDEVRTKFGIWDDDIPF
ncbi:hypothetical protein [Vibrio cionasavignyae]|uniref:hypothetical protein n=1 Tax=Vibrio cionasavignyae TaxID=2910252 RepID=UPI003D0CBEED